MSNSLPERKKTTVLEAFETLFKKRDYAGGTHPVTELHSAQRTHPAGQNGRLPSINCLSPNPEWHVSRRNQSLRRARYWHRSDLSIEPGEVAPLAEYFVPGTLDLIVLATKRKTRLMWRTSCD
jgi:hypothetical protein